MSKKTAVVLFQLGGPDSLDAVEPFLYNLFMDPDIIDFPGAFLARKYLARRIASRRSKPIGEHYKEIGGKSPINELTRHQADALERSLRENSMDATVFVAMRYWNPLTGEAIQRIQDGGFEQIILLPLYPQFSKATTFSSLNEWNRRIKGSPVADLPTRLICCYPNHSLYVEAIAENINRALQRFEGISRRDIDLVFSAHGVPMDFIRKGDPYKLHIEATVRSVVQHGAWECPHLLCYQSKVGPARWLEPSLLGTITDRARKGRRHLLVVPIAFVTEHIETLHEINIEAREAAIHHGIETFEMMPALNDHPKFIRCLTDLVMSRMGSEGSTSLCRQLWREASENPEPTLCPWYFATNA